MPAVTIADQRYYYRFDGADAAPVLILSHSLGLDHAMWDEQVADLQPHLRLLRYDTRGHGASSAPAGDYDVASLAQDVLALADALQIDRFAFCGLSLGGMIGQWLGVHAPDRVTRLVLANTSPRPDADLMEQRRRAVLDKGLAAIGDAAMTRFFSPEPLRRNLPRIAWARRTLLATSAQGYAGCCAAIRDWDGRSTLRDIRPPTLIIAGDRDVPMPWDTHSAILARDIAGARVVRLPAAHLSNIEQPRSFSAALAEFLVLAADPDVDGLAIRRLVLGDAHVDRAIAATTDFTRDFQQMITRYAWGTVWTRPGLDVRTRRLLVVATTAAMGRWEEFRLHVRAGLANELEPADLKEVLLQVAIYAGVPAANTAFHIATEEMSPRSGA
jgi:3-oxoadipate enol-lactonase / 4-carboxymuconolactone decarboxylase